MPSLKRASARIVSRSPSERDKKAASPGGNRITGGLTRSEVRSFRSMIYRHYRNYSRDFMPWRKTGDPYHVLVSEIMLQQTQVERVLVKYPLFIKTFPDFQSLARAPVSALYAVWQGMGYNRRALALKKASEIVSAEPYGGTLPSSVEELVELPGVGRATACAVAAFAFHQPVAFIETNIRRVFIHCFFPGRKGVSDRDILPLVEQTVDAQDPQTWYYALMDYGAMLAKQEVNPNRRSAHYTRQSPFAGSNRQLRGRVLRLLSASSALSLRETAEALKAEQDRVRAVLDQLSREGFITRKGRKFVMV